LLRLIHLWVSLYSRARGLVGFQVGFSRQEFSPPRRMNLHGIIARVNDPVTDPSGSPLSLSDRPPWLAVREFTDRRPPPAPPEILLLLVGATLVISCDDERSLSALSTEPTFLSRSTPVPTTTQ